MLIRLIPVGDVPPKILNALKEDLSEALPKQKFIIDSGVPLPKDAYNRFKEQYRAEYILDVLRDRGVLLAVTTADIFADKLNFVYGLAEYRGPAIVSTARLDPQFYKESPNFQLLMSRLVKEAIHEIGHIFGLSHCQYPECVMSYSNNVKFVDKKKKWFCDSCKVKMSTEGIDLC